MPIFVNCRTERAPVADRPTIAQIPFRCRLYGGLHRATASGRGAFCWTCPAAAKVFLDAVEMSDLAQDPSATLRALLARLVEVASRVGPAYRSQRKKRKISANLREAECRSWG